MAVSVSRIGRGRPLWPINAQHGATRSRKLQASRVYQVAFEVMKALQADGLERDQEYRPFLQATLVVRLIEQQIAQALHRNLNALDAEDEPNRRNGYYQLQFLDYASATSNSTCRGLNASAGRATGYGRSMFSNSSSGLKMAGNVSSSRTR